jgi:O-antigen ligase
LIGMLAVLGFLPMAISLRRQRGTYRVLTAAVLVGVLLSIQFALFGILQRLESDPLDDQRWRYAKVTREAAADFAPWGTGLGTFRQAFQPYEVDDDPEDAIVNHAHNDYLELWLEGGVPAAVLLAAGGAIWLAVGLALLRRTPEAGTPESRDRLIGRSAWLAASLALVHSSMDYPLRTTANLAVFSVLAGIAFAAASRQPGGQTRPRIDKEIAS